MLVTMSGSLPSFFYAALLGIVASALMLAVIVSCLCRNIIKVSESAIRSWAMQIRWSKDRKLFARIRPLGVKIAVYGIWSQERGLLICEDIIGNAVTLIMAFWDKNLWKAPGAFQLETKNRSTYSWYKHWKWLKSHEYERIKFVKCCCNFTLINRELVRAIITINVDKENIWFVHMYTNVFGDWVLNLYLEKLLNNLLHTESM